MSLIESGAVSMGAAGGGRAGACRFGRAREAWAARAVVSVNMSTPAGGGGVGCQVVDGANGYSQPVSRRGRGGCWGG